MNYNIYNKINTRKTDPTPFNTKNKIYIPRIKDNLKYDYNSIPLNITSIKLQDIIYDFVKNINENIEKIVLHKQKEENSEIYIVQFNILIIIFFLCIIIMIFLYNTLNIYYNIIFYIAYSFFYFLIVIGFLIILKEVFENKQIFSKNDLIKSLLNYQIDNHNEYLKKHSIIIKYAENLQYIVINLN